ncbi:MAG: hypothetical protein ACP5T4_03080 [Candidatus Micrarchaeia archaeon]
MKKVLLVYAFWLLSLSASLAFGQQPTFEQLTLNLLCGLINSIKAIVGVLALVLFVLGGIFYALGHFLPATGSLRQNVQGWSMGMLFAGIVALVVFLIAQPLLSMIVSLGVSAGSPSIPVSCAQPSTQPVSKAPYAIAFNNSTASGIIVYNFTRTYVVGAKIGNKSISLAINSISENSSNVIINGANFALTSGKTYSINNTSRLFAYFNMAKADAINLKVYELNAQHANATVAPKAPSQQKKGWPSWLTLLVLFVCLSFILIILHNIIVYNRVRRNYEERMNKEKAEGETQNKQAG